MYKYLNFSFINSIEIYGLDGGRSYKNKTKKEDEHGLWFMNTPDRNMRRGIWSLRQTVVEGQEKNLKNIKKGKLLSLITYEFVKNLV